MKNLVYSADQVQRTIVRMAYEIYENNLSEKVLVIAGILDQGYVLAELLAGEIRKISPLEIILVGVSIDKNSPYDSRVSLDTEAGVSLEGGKALILVDDVLNSGRTFAYCLRALLSFKFSKVEIAVLVNRSHKLYPISAKYKGYDLSTTISDHVEVQLAGQVSVFLH